MERLVDLFERGVLVLLALLLGFITIGVFVQVVLRYLFHTAFLWGEELSLFAFIWCVYLGAAVGVRRRTHFAFDVLAGLLKGRAAGLQSLLVDLTVLAVAAVMLAEGYAFSRMSAQRLSPALGITFLVPTVVIPVSGALMVLASLGHLARDLRRLRSGRAA